MIAKLATISTLTSVIPALFVLSLTARFAIRAVCAQIVAQIILSMLMMAIATPLVLKIAAIATSILVFAVPAK